jgi:hypothetical protein
VSGVKSVEGLKFCNGCESDLPHSRFYLRKDGYYNSRCKTCTIERQREYRKRNPERYRAYSRKWGRENREKKAEIQAAWVAAYPLRRYALKYGIDESELAQMFAAADGRCNLCDKTSRLNIDHCHDTGKVRGLLCTSCNTALGKLGDRVEDLRRAIRYLEGDRAGS